MKNSLIENSYINNKLVFFLITAIFIFYILSKYSLIPENLRNFFENIKYLFVLALLIKLVNINKLVSKTSVYKFFSFSILVYISYSILNLISFSAISFLNIFLISLIPVVIIFSLIMATNFNNSIIYRKLLLTLFFLFIIFILLSFLTPEYLIYKHYGIDRLRYVFGFVKPSYLAEISILLIFLTLFIHVNYKNSMNKKTVYFLLFVLILILFLSNSRTAIFSLIIFYITYKFINSKYSLIKIIIGIFIAIPIFYLLFDLNFNTLNQILSGRLNWWLIAIKNNLKTFDDFIFGIGYGNAVTNQVILGLISKSEAGKSFHVDSFFVEILIHQGIIGIFLILILFFSLSGIRNNNLSMPILNAMFFYGFFESIIFHFATLFAFLTWIIFFTKVHEHEK